MTTKTATGWVAQDNLMTYATREIAQIPEAGSTTSWDIAAGRADLTWDPATEPVYDSSGRLVQGYQLVAGKDVHLAVTSDRYKVVDHSRHLRQVVETIVAERNAPITALVVLDGGKRVGVRVTHETTVLAGDPSPIQKETWAWLRHDARGALAVIENAQRMFCTNQMPVLSRVESTDLAIRHVGDIDVKVEGLVERLRSSADDWALWEAEMATLRQAPVTTAQFERFTKLYVPEPVPPVSATRARNAQEELSVLFRSYKDVLGQTAYAGFQAIVEWEDKQRAARGAAGRFQRAIQPNPNKERGLRMLMEVAR